MIPFVLMSCALPSSVVMLSGQVLTAQDSEAGAPDVRVIIRNAASELHGEVTTDEDGMFEIEIPGSNAYHMVLQGEDSLPTAFSGIVGQSDVAIPADELFVRSDAEILSLRDEFSACPTASDEGAIIEGVVRFKLQNTDDQSFLVAPLTAVTAFNQEGVEYTACYLDDDGVSVEEQDDVGNTGRFAVFGIPEGPTTVRFQQNIGGMIVENFWLRICAREWGCSLLPSLCGSRWMSAAFANFDEPFAWLIRGLIEYGWKDITKGQPMPSTEGAGGFDLSFVPESQGRSGILLRMPAMVGGQRCHEDDSYGFEVRLTRVQGQPGIAARCAECNFLQEFAFDPNNPVWMAGYLHQALTQYVPEYVRWRLDGGELSWAQRQGVPRSRVKPVLRACRDGSATTEPEPDL